jgi:thiol-disulfide isomerase/thioredoxin
MVEIQTMEQWEQHIQSKDLVLAKFYTDWCPDCKRIDPFLPEVEQAFQDKILFLSVNRDKFPELGEQLNIFGIPSFVSFLSGKELIRFVSREAKSREEIERFIQRTLQMAGEIKDKNSL